MSVIIDEENVKWFEDMWQHMHEMYEAGEYEYGDDAACDMANMLHKLITEQENA